MHKYVLLGLNELMLGHLPMVTFIAQLLGIVET